MTTVLGHVERLRAKPHHVRKQVAIGGALGVSALIAFVWVALSLSTGAWQIQGTSFADAGGASNVTTVNTGADNVAGAAAAVSSYGDANGPSIQVVDAPAAPAKAQEATVIPF